MLALLYTAVLQQERKRSDQLPYQPSLKPHTGTFSKADVQWHKESVSQPQYSDSSNSSSPIHSILQCHPVQFFTCVKSSMEFACRPSVCRPTATVILSSAS